MPRLAALLVAALALLASGCGEEDSEESLVNEDGLRECMIEAGLTTDRPSSGGSVNPNPLLVGPAPDFVVYSQDGAVIRVIVQGSDEKAERTAADVDSALQTLGGPTIEATSSRNVVFIVEPPSEETRRAIESCL